MSELTTADLEKMWQMSEEIDSSPSVIAYRLGTMEKVVNGIDKKLDGLGDKFVTKEYLELTLEPLRQDLEGVKNNNNTLAIRRWAMFTAVLSPVVVAMILYIILPGR